MDLSRYDDVAWQAAVRDCWWLVRDFYFHEYQISLPRICVNSGDPLTARREIKRNPARNLFSSLQVPVHGCVVELSMAHYADHIGIYLNLNGEPWLLHNERGVGVCITPMEEIFNDYQITGYFEYVGKRA